MPDATAADATAPIPATAPAAAPPDASALAFRVGSRDDGSRDGRLVLVSPDLARVVEVPAEVARTLQGALDDWARVAPRLQALHDAREAGSGPDGAGEGGWRGAGSAAFDPRAMLAPLPRAHQWLDASVYRHHAELMYRWRGEPLPPRYDSEPLVYQGGSDALLPGHAPLSAVDAAHGVDLEAEIGVITTDVPRGTGADAALGHVALVVLINDVSLRNLIADEVGRGFGFVRSKPASHVAPVAVTPGALRRPGATWRGGLLHARVEVDVDGRRLGAPDAGAGAVFHVGQVIAHVATTRSLGAGSIVGLGTVSNDPAAAADGADPGSACLTEARVRAALAGVPEDGRPAYLRDGQRLRIDVRDAAGASVFGAIEQVVRIEPTPPSPALASASASASASSFTRPPP